MYMYVLVCECFALSLSLGDRVSDLEVDIYRFMVSCKKGQRGETERFTLSLSVYVPISVVGRGMILQ